MSVALTYSHGIGNFPRSYIRGFCTDNNFPIVSLTDHTLELTQAGYDVQVYLVIRPHFYQANSNVYSLDYVFDSSASSGFYLGLPYPFGFDVQLIGDPDDFSYRIYLPSGLGFNHSVKADLPPLSSYWLPR